MTYRSPAAYGPDLWDAPPETDPAPVLCPMCRSAEDCDCGNEPLYTCDSCDRQVPQDEIRHIRESYCGETYQCERCIDAEFAEASGDHRRRGGEW